MTDFLQSMISSTKQVGKLFLLAASFFLVFNVWKIQLEERELNYTEPRNASQWAVELKNKESFKKLFKPIKLKKLKFEEIVFQFSELESFLPERRGRSAGGRV